MNHDREILAAVMDWHAANITRLAVGAESNRYKRASMAATGYGGSHPELGARVTKAKRIELIALRKLAKVCAKSLKVDVIDVDASEPPVLFLPPVIHATVINPGQFRPYP